MADKPILFNGPMVRAIIDGRKTQTRRGLRNVQEDITSEQAESLELMGWDTFWNGGDLCAAKIPYAIGDRLWVRETWAVGNIYDGIKPSEINPYGKPGWCGIRYKATDHRIGIHDRPSIHMPRWASRLTLVITDVRIQRLQEISAEDAIAEGLVRGDQLPFIPDSHGTIWHDGVTDPIDGWTRNPRQAFAYLWRACYGRGAWETNPWVVATTFKAHHCNIDKMGED